MHDHPQDLARDTVVGVAPGSGRLCWFRWLVPAGALIVLLILGETAFHLIPNHYRDLVPMKTTGEWHTPDKTYTYYGALLGARQPPDIAPNVVRWNHGGWNDVDHTVTKPPRTLRVLVLGDSYVEGIQVRQAELYHRRLEDMLRDRAAGFSVETMAMGASGWGQVHELDALRTKGLAYRPDLVIAEFLPGNDVRNNEPELERLANEQAQRSTLARVLFIRALNAGLLLPSYFFDRLDLGIRQWRGQQDPVDCDVYRDAPDAVPELWGAAWTRTGALLSEMKTVASGAGAELVVVFFTSPMEIDAHVPGTPPAPNRMDMRLPGRRLAAICAERSLQCLDLAPRFARLPGEERQRIHLAGDGHWSRDGHHQAARETSRYLTEETSIWRTMLRRVSAVSGT